MRSLALVALVACTTTTHTTIDRTNCDSCHATEYDSAPQFDNTPPLVSTCVVTDHVALGYPRTCSNCHGTTSWCLAADGVNQPKHPWSITSGSHAGWDCGDCHTAITYTPPVLSDPKLINCTGCHWHDQAQTDPHHIGNGKYTYGPMTCLASDCHGGGKRQ